MIPQFLASIRFFLFSVLGFCSAHANAQSAPEARTLTAERLAQMRDLIALETSPDGRWLAVVTRSANPETNEYAQTWRRVATNGDHSVIDLADGGKPYLPRFETGGFSGGFLKAPTAVWSPDSRWLAYTKVEGGRSQAWRVRYDGREEQQLTDIDDDIIDLKYSEDGTRLFFRTKPSEDKIRGALDVEGLQGFLYDDRTSIYHGLAPAWPVNSSLSPEYVVYEFATARTRPASVAEVDQFEQAPIRTLTEVARVRNVIVSSVDGDLAWAEPRSSKRNAARPPLTIVAMKEGTDVESVCSATACTNASIRGLWWRERNREDAEVIFVVGDRRNGPPSNSVYAWVPGHDSVRRIVKASGILRHCQISESQLVCIQEAPAFPRSVIAIDLASGQIEKLFDPNADLAGYSFGRPPQWLKVPTADEFNSYGYLIVPPNYEEGVRLPLVIVGYRCFDFLRGGTGDEYPIYPLAAEGFAVFCFEPPLDDFGVLAQVDAREYLKYVYAPGDPRQRRIRDALDAAIDQLEEIGVIDINRIAITGYSSGAQMVNYALHSSRHKITAAISSYVIFDPVNFHISGPAGRSWFRSFGLGGSDETPERWKTISLRKNITEVNTPILFNVADREMIMTLPTVNALRDAAKPVEMRVFPDEYHYKWQPAHRLAIYRQNIDWLKFWLKNEEADAAIDPDQYRRWRKLRSDTCTDDHKVVSSYCEADVRQVQ